MMLTSATRGQASEVILGKAIKKYNLPRDEIVVMTKAFAPVGRGAERVSGKPKAELEADRYVNQSGLSRKVLSHIYFLPKSANAPFKFSIYSRPSSIPWRGSS